MNRICSTEEFAKAMCSVTFKRLTPYKGQDEDTVYITKNPPEYVEGFMEKVITEIRSLLNLS